MKRFAILALMIGCLMPKPAEAADIPFQVGGFRLAAPIEEFRKQIKPDTALPIRYQEYLTEVEILENGHFKSGLIAYGACADPGKIVRIKLKYADDSRALYERLLNSFTKRFGKPVEWRGDPFRVKLAWKWSFKDRHNNRISLVLQHNTKDLDEKLGNAVKMTLTSQEKKELRCWTDKHPETGANAPAPADFNPDVMIPH